MAFSITAGSTRPNTNCRIQRLPTSTTAPMTVASSAVIQISCRAAAQALCRSRRPRYWLTTTAPPVASAANTWISKTFTESTSEMPDTAASPTRDTIIVSAMPTVTASSCSTISGRISAHSARVENSGFACTLSIRFIPPVQK